MVVSSLWGLFDGIFVGQFLGEQAFAAVNLAFPLMLINFSLADLIGVGSAVPISIAMGKKQEQEASNYFTCACIMIVASGLFVGLLLYMAAPALLSLMGAEGELRELATEYIRVYAICSPVTTIVFAVDNFLRICGRIKTSMALNILMSVMIMGLELLCLSVLDMGIGGSALAVSSGMFICAVVALYPFWRRQLPLRFCRPRFSARLIRQIVSSGSPTFLSNTAARLASILMNVVLLRVGRTERHQRLRRAHVCGRHRPAAAVWHLRFPAAGHWLQLGRRTGRQGQKHRSNAACARAPSFQSAALC